VGQDADSYSGLITNAAFTLIKRNFARRRNAWLAGRAHGLMPRFWESEEESHNPPEVYTRIAIEQIDR